LIFNKTRESELDALRLCDAYTDEVYAKDLTNSAALKLQQIYTDRGIDTSIITLHCSNGCTIFGRSKVIAYFVDGRIEHYYCNYCGDKWLEAE